MSLQAPPEYGGASSMPMRSVTLILVVGILVLQWPMWFGKGSWIRVMQIESQLSEQRTVNERLLARNTAMAADVRDLKQGHEAVEERARNELGMVKPGEVFFQVLGRPSGR